MHGLWTDGNLAIVQIRAVWRKGKSAHGSGWMSSQVPLNCDWQRKLDWQLRGRSGRRTTSVRGPSPRLPFAD
jgi:hypothetical protein